jgi:ribose/xylose/arabinose/galactoside ABC-type transport system permease subunit
MMTPDLRPLTRPLGGGTRLAVWVALAALLLFGLLRYDNFASAYNLSSFLGCNSMFVLISVGMCLVIMTGGIDLSVGTVAALASVVAALLSPYGLMLALPAGFGAGLAAGALNAGMITGLRLPPFMATLASMLAAKGLRCGCRTTARCRWTGHRISRRWAWARWRACCPGRS